MRAGHDFYRRNRVSQALPHGTGTPLLCYLFCVLRRHTQKEGEASDGNDTSWINIVNRRLWCQPAWCTW